MVAVVALDARCDTELTPQTGEKLLARPESAVVVGDQPGRGGLPRTCLTAPPTRPITKGRVAVDEGVVQVEAGQPRLVHQTPIRRRCGSRPARRRLER